MSLDTSLRSAERAGDWQSQVTYLRRAGRFVEAIEVAAGEGARLLDAIAAVSAEATNEYLVRATVRPASERLTALHDQRNAVERLVRSLRDEHRLASSWQVRCPSCGDERATTVNEPACDECARAGQWVRMLPVEQCPAVARKPRAPRRRRKGGR